MPFMEFLRGRIPQAVLTEYSEVEIRTPVSKTEELAMLIHMIETKVIKCPMEDLQTREASCHLAECPSDHVRGIEEPECLYHHGVWSEAGYSEGTLTEHSQFYTKEIDRQVFNPPILYAKDSIYLGVICDNPVNLTTATCRIGYTLERVSSMISSQP